MNLVASKLNLELTILDVNIVSSNFDIIIVEDELFDNNFPISNFTSRLGIITQDNNLFENVSDFLLSKPFLPSQLLDILKEQIEFIKNNKNIDEEVEEIEQSEEFIDTLVDDISFEIEEENDESVVPSAFIKGGGILDTNELSKIKDILDEPEEKLEEEDDWIDLSNIIDKAISEVKEYQFKVEEPIKLILNEYSLNELSSLLNKLDQNIIDALTNGKEITLKLKVNK
jgi:hypothetical protein